MATLRARIASTNPMVAHSRTQPTASIRGAVTETGSGWPLRRMPERLNDRPTSSRTHVTPYSPRRTNVHVAARTEPRRSDHWIQATMSSPRSTMHAPNTNDNMMAVKNRMRAPAAMKIEACWRCLSSISVMQSELADCYVQSARQTSTDRTARGRPTSLHRRGPSLRVFVHIPNTGPSRRRTHARSLHGCSGPVPETCLEKRRADRISVRPHAHLVRQAEGFSNRSSNEQSDGLVPRILNLHDLQELIVRLSTTILEQFGSTAKRVAAVDPIRYNDCQDQERHRGHYAEQGLHGLSTMRTDSTRRALLPPLRGSVHGPSPTGG